MGSPGSNQACVDRVGCSISQSMVRVDAVVEHKVFGVEFGSSLGQTSVVFRRQTDPCVFRYKPLRFRVFPEIPWLNYSAERWLTAILESTLLSLIPARTTESDQTGTGDNSQRE